MNKHIELVKKWLDDPTSVTQQELEDNRNAADAANAANAANYDAATSVPFYAAAYYAAFYASYVDSDYAYADDAAANAVFWVKRYEELKEQDDE
jgi:hypothetical protein